MTPRKLFLPAMALALAPALAAADPDFEAVVRGLEMRLETQRLRIPLFGVVNFFVKVARPAGVRQLDLVVFEDVRRAPPGNDEFAALLRGAAGDRWRPLVRTRSRRNDDEWVHIYSRPSGHDLLLLVATFERSEATLVKLKISEKALLDLIDEPCTMGRRLKKGD